MLAHTDADIIINFQGDAPLIPSDFVEALIDHMKVNRDSLVATAMMACDADMLASLKQDRRQGLVGGTTVVFNHNRQAMYFSKEILPIADSLSLDAQDKIHLHIGLYAYRREALEAYMKFEEGRLEKIEGLEQLRFLENAIRVDCVEVAARGRAFWEVNLPEDVKRVEDALHKRGIE